MFKNFFKKDKKETGNLQHSEARLHIAVLRRGEGGFFLLYAVFFATIILIIGMGIVEVAMKQVSFSGIDRESVRAFYVSDAAIDCVLYEDLGQVAGSVFSTSSPGTITCNGNNVSLGAAQQGTQANPPHFVFNFWLNRSDPKEKSCASVIFDQTIDDGGYVATTTVSVLGYNTGCPNVDTQTRFPVVVRGLRTVY